MRLILVQGITPIGVFVAIFLGGFVCQYIVDRFVLPLTARTDTVIDGVVVRNVRDLLIPGFLLGALSVATHRANLLSSIVGYVDTALVVSSLALALFLCARIISDLGRVYAQPGHRAAPVAGMLQRIAQIVVLSVGAVMILRLLGTDITPILTTMGVAGLAAALALQDTLSNFFAGFYLLADRPVRVGDFVKIETGEEGYVTEVGWRSTKIRTLPNNIVIVPNQKLAQSIVTNYYMPERRMSLLVPVSVSYDSDPEKVEHLLTAVAMESAGSIAGLLADPPPFVRFIPGFGAYSLDFTLICQVQEFTDQYLVQHELRKRLFRRLREEGIEIPFPVQTVRFDRRMAGQEEALSRLPSVPE